MKKLSFIVAMALAVVANYSCGEYDNSVLDNGKTTITDANGNPYEVGSVATFLANPGDEVKMGIQVTDGKDYYALKSGDNIVTAQVNDQEIVTLTLNEVAEDGKVLLLGNNNIKTLVIDNAYLADIIPEKIADLVTLGLSNIDAESMELPKFGKLENFSLLNSGLETIVLGDNSDLKTLTINNNKNLKAIDLKKYYKLETVDLSMNALTTIELSNEYANLTDFNAADNQLTSFDASKMRHLKTLDLQNNQLAGEINLAVCTDLETAYLQNNELTSVLAGNVTKELNIANNKLGFDAMPLPASIKGDYTYAPQKDIDATVTNGILDLSAQYEIDGNITTFEFDPESTEIDAMENGKFAFPNAVKNVVVTMTNAAFPGLTLKTAPITSEAASNILYSFDPANDTEATGGQIVSVHTKTGTPSDEIDYLHFIDDYKTKGFYTTILVNGTKESVEGKPFHYIRVDLDEPLKEGNIIRFTGFRLTPTSAHGSLYLLFDLLNDNNERTYKDYRPGDEFTCEYAETEMFANIYDTKLVPDVLQLKIDGATAGSKSFKIARNEADTEVYLTKIEILRKAE